MTKDFFFALFSEADSYRSLEVIEEMLEKSGDLSNIPIQPLYMVFKSQAPEKAAEWLPTLSTEQRQLFLDIDLWEKDEIDVGSFTYWVLAYHACHNDQVKKDFLTSESFALYLKGKFNIWTFDAEDPEYPDHDNYFLTDDSLLLFEFDDEFQYVDELRQLIRELYGLFGVEKAYAHLFKIVSDTYSMTEEEEYRMKKERLRDVGMVDYFEAIELDNPFANQVMLDHYIKSKKPVSPDLDSFSKNQSLHSLALTAYREKMSDFSQEMQKVQKGKRFDYLRFSFVRLVNATLSASGAWKDGSIAVNRVGIKSRNYLQLGLNYLNEVSVAKGDLSIEPNQSVLEYFDFVEIYKIGLSLIRFLQKDVKKSLRENDFNHDNESFLGIIWNEFIDHLLDSPSKVVASENAKAEDITSLDKLATADKGVQTLLGLMPFMKQMYLGLNQLKSNGRLHDHFYLNYNVDEIDFESIILSSFANFYLGHLKQDSAEKLGLTVEEFRRFAIWLLSEEGEFEPSEDIRLKLKEFLNSFGLSKVSYVEDYFYSLIKRHIEGYEYSELEEEEFKHVGGPIILNSLKQ